MKLEEKTFPFEVKSLTEAGSFEGYAAIFNKPDSMNEIVEPGAFTKSLKEGSSRPLLWYHDVRQPLGLVELTVDKKGLKVEGQLELEIKAAYEKYLMLKKKIIRGMSFGFKTIKDSWEGKFRRLNEVKLWEVSLATFQMHPKAVVTAVKSDDPKSFEEAVASLQRNITALEEFKEGKSISTGDRKIVDNAIEALNALQTAEPSPDTRREEKSILTPVIEGLEKSKASKPQPHLFDSLIRTLEQ